MDRQHNYTSLASTLPMFSTNLDNNSVQKFYNYNFNNSTRDNTSKSPYTINRTTYFNADENNSDSINNLLYTYSKLLPTKFSTLNIIDFTTFLKTPSNTNFLSYENDSKQFANPLRFILGNNQKKKSLWNFEYLLSDLNTNLKSPSLTDNYNLNLYNTENILKFKDYKSSNLQFLGSERTVRLLKNLNSDTYKWNTSSTPNTVSTLNNQVSTYGGTQNDIYQNSLNNWLDSSKLIKYTNNIV
jgi:hypothetical protein